MASETNFITLEEHYMIPEILVAQNDANILTDWHPGVDLSFVSLPSLTEKLKDLGERRIEEMKTGKIQMQLLSHAPTFLPNEPTTETCHKANEIIYKAIQNYPLHFGGMIWLNMRDQEGSVKEMSLRISQGFKGIFIDDHTPDGDRYDDPKFWKVFEMAEKLDVPIYLHPTYAPSAHVEKPQLATSSTHCGNYTPIVAGMLSSASLGWHSETAMHILRLFSSGLFERFPKLKLILGHDGEGLPFFFHRIAHNTRWFPIGPEGSKQIRSFETVWKENLWFTTSGMFDVAPLACMLRSIHPSKIMYSVDYPFSTPKTGLDFMENLKKSGLVTEEEWQGIGWKNAKSLFKME